MTVFTHEDQIAYAKLALGLLNSEKLNSTSIDTILNFGELIKKYSDKNNALIYDATEYIYEQLRLMNDEEGAYDDMELRKKLERIISGSCQ